MNARNAHPTLEKYLLALNCPIAQYQLLQITEIYSINIFRKKELSMLQISSYIVEEPLLILEL
ncbi:hypothetical protein ACQCT3_10690 [Sutcliffiella horikoshii]